MQRWLNESSQEGPWSAVVADAESSNGEKLITQKEQEVLSKSSDNSSPSYDSCTCILIDALQIFYRAL
jgi:hypothetical protein